MAKKKAVSKPAEPHSPVPSTLKPGVSVSDPSDRRTGIRHSGLQSGDLQGLPAREDTDFESVEELAAEGQAREAEILSGVRDAPDADQGEIRTREVPADDVPQEYKDED